jgi:hypothetical protein
MNAFENKILILAVASTQVRLTETLQRISRHSEDKEKKSTQGWLNKKRILGPRKCFIPRETESREKKTWN